MKITPPGDILEVQDGDGPEIMGAEMRAELCGTGAPLAVRRAKASITTKYGESVGFEVMIGGNGPRKGEVYMLMLKSNDVRVRQAEGFIRALALPDTEAVGPVYLGQITTKSDQVAWVLQNEPYVGSVDSSNQGQRSEPVAAGAVGTDDDIPF